MKSSSVGDLGQPGCRALDFFCYALSDILKCVAQYCPDDIVFVREVLVKSGCSNSTRQGDLCHGDPVDPVFVEKFFRRFEYPAPLTFTMRVIGVRGWLAIY